jgi:hypothetical protein
LCRFNVLSQSSHPLRSNLQSRSNLQYRSNCQCQSSFGFDPTFSIDSIISFDSTIGVVLAHRFPIISFDSTFGVDSTVRLDSTIRLNPANRFDPAIRFDPIVGVNQSLKMQPISIQHGPTETYECVCVSFHLNTSCVYSCNHRLLTQLLTLSSTILMLSRDAFCINRKTRDAEILCSSDP